ncbi:MULTISPECIES: hypothetical protein [unclassified Ruegeria]|uniref:hypothetical protein n=1 Tax=unclassified Ruegeria TaxID=2625375 RepID=UPI001489FBAC|nr:MULTISPECIES: hypothetical protein [unclassified Ruegeria]NOD33721.1 hypothetical protein [Ruegeria sp. HKCCD7296]NOD45980.1 hypothetical protein [Ruegeria sp. HKCCD5849]NOD50720.1 hypothetical protein [Ruegeria sp. HKCCD5851]NOD67536.1 hypothetical protein [Ruegeria sp. HKCCD7303]NOE33122.1 hypothetical protein [Ruegeria sp. HKCCD7318]
MFLELIGTIFAGFAFAGVVLVLNKLTGGRLPKWTTPVAAGLGMIGMTIASEYSWYDRTRDQLPDEMAIVQEVESRAFYRPWTYAVPFVDRFAAIDTISVRSNENVPDQRLVDLYFFGRWAPVSKVPVAVNCVENSRANLADGAEFADDGRLINADWISAEANDPIIETTCGV